MTSLRGRYSDPGVTERRWRDFARLFEAQYGVVSRSQLLAIGFSPAAIKNRLRAGYLIQMYRGVYAVGRADLRPEGRWMAAVLACGTGAVLSHLTCAAHRELLQSASGRIDVTVPAHRRVRPHQRIRVHGARLHPADVTLHERIPVTSIPRTLLDLAEVVAPKRVRAALEVAQGRHLLDFRDMRSLIARSNGRRGLKVLVPLLAELDDDPPEYRSPLEREFRDLIRRAGLPLPAMNVVVEGIVVDAYWPKYGLIVEVDGYASHSSKEQFEEDHTRTEALQDAGLEVRRFTRERVMGNPDAVVASVTRALRSLGWSG